MYPNTIFLGMGLYEICILLGVVVALILADRIAVKKGFSVALQKMLILSVVGAVVIGFFGAILFQAFYDWLETGEFSLQAGMTFYGGFIFGVGGFLFFWLLVSKAFGVQKEALARTKDVADMAGCIVPLAHGFGRLGCFFAGCCHGNVTEKWYGVKMWVYLANENGEGTWQWAKVVPLQLFEAAVLFALAAVLFAVFIKRNKTGKKRVPVLPLYFIGYAIWRFCIEFARGDERGASPVPFLSPSQFIAVILFAAGVVYLCIWLKTIKKEIGNGKNYGNGGV